MKNKIYIVFILLAYLLNMAHDVLKHEHYDDSFFRRANNQALVHFHDIKTECIHSEHESQKLPFNHCHFLHSHDNFQIKNTLTNIHIPDISVIYDFNYCFQPPDISLENIFQKNEINISQTFINTSLFLRAPPTVS